MSIQMENLKGLTVEEKMVQVLDVVGLMETRIAELEEEVARLGSLDDKTVACGDDVANLDDFEEGEPPLKEEKVVKFSEKVEVKEVKEVKKKGKKEKKETNEDYMEASKMPYDPLKCRRRVWRGGFGCQCNKPVFEMGLCKGDHGKLYGDKKKVEWSEKETFPEGYYDEPLQMVNLITGKSQAWKDPETGLKFGAKKKKEKKKEKKEKKVVKEEAEEGVPPVVKAVVVPEVPEEVPEVPEEVMEVPEEVMEVPEVPYELEEELGDINEEDDRAEEDQYDEFEYQGVGYMLKGPQVFTVNFQHVGHLVGQVVEFKDEESQKYHENHDDREEE